MVPRTPGSARRDDARGHLVILTLNEIDGVTDVFPKLPMHCLDEVLVVDGGSTDGTPAVLRIAGRTGDPPGAAGPGRGLPPGRPARAQRVPGLLQPRRQRGPRRHPAAVDGLVDGYDMVIASRFMTGARSEDDDKFLFASRRWGNLLFTWLANVLCGRGHRSPTPSTATAPSPAPPSRGCARRPRLRHRVPDVDPRAPAGAPRARDPDAGIAPHRRGSVQAQRHPGGPQVRASRAQPGSG